MLCQANKPNTGILQEKKTRTFCYRAIHFITGKLDSLFSLLHVWSVTGFGKETIYLKATYQKLVYLPQKAESLK